MEILAWIAIILVGILAMTLADMRDGGNNEKDRNGN